MFSRNRRPVKQVRLDNNLDKLYGELKQALKKGDIKSQVKLIRAMKIRAMKAVSHDTGELHTLNSRHSTCQDMSRFIDPKGPRDGNIMNSKFGVR